MHFFRRKNQTDLKEVAAFVEGDMAGTGQLQGYRWMHQWAIQRGFVVSQETIRLIIKILDPKLDTLSTQDPPPRFYPLIGSAASINEAPISRMMIRVIPPQGESVIPMIPPSRVPQPLWTASNAHHSIYEVFSYYHGVAVSCMPPSTLCGD